MRQEEKTVEVKFEVKMTPQIMYNFMLNHTYKSLTGVLGVIFGIASFAMFGVTFGKTTATFSGLYLLFGIWFVLYLPVNLYVRSKRQVKNNAVFQKPITYVVNDKGIQIIQDKQKADCKWENIVKVCRTGKSLLVYSGKRNAFVLPKEAVGEQYDTLEKLLRKNMPGKKVKL